VGFGVAFAVGAGVGSGLGVGFGVALGVGLGVGSGSGVGGAETETEPPFAESANLSRSSELNVTLWVPMVSFDDQVNVTPCFQSPSLADITCGVPSRTTLTWSGGEPSRFL
jgi:hypothetical protein